MTTALTKSLLDELDTLTQGLTSGRLSAVEWHNETARTLFVYHLAAYAEASGKDERDVLGQVKKIVGKQVDYLNKFTDDIEAGRYTDKDAALQARTTLYAGALNTTYAAGQSEGWDVPDSLLPGNQQCLGNCLCRIAITDNGDGTGVLTRTMGGTEHHCKECPALEGDHPIKRRAA